MNQQEICDIVDMLNDAINTKDWELVEETLMYIKDYCPDYEEETEDED